MGKIFQKIHIFLFLFFIISHFTYAQISVSGTITDASGLPVSGANVAIEGSKILTSSDVSGKYQLLVAPGTYTLAVSFLGLNSESRMILVGNEPITEDFRLTTSNQELTDIIVTGTFNSQSRLTSSIASDVLSEKKLKDNASLGTADLLSNTTGTFVDASAGSIFTRVYTRGISSSAEDDIGWYYMSLQEDGLPITNYQTTYYGPDLFHRVDLTTKRLEAVRGGSSMVTSTNTPGGIFNFISKNGGDEFSAEMVATGGLQGENNLLARYDLNISGPLSSHGWAYNIGGFYRYDQGARNTDINWENGGQIRGNLTKKSKNGIIRISLKYLDDKVNRYQGLAATNWSDPQPAFGQNFNYTALNLPKINTDISDGRSVAEDSESTYNYNTNNGIKTKDLALGLLISHSYNGWNINSNFKYSDKLADWNSTIANQPLGLEGVFPYLLSGIDPTFQSIPIGNVVFRDANSNEIVASVNNFGILGPFQGQPASFEYLEGSLPNDAVMGIAPWKKIDEAIEIMEEFKINKEFKDHSVTGGLFYAYADLESFTSASYAYSTYENSPRALYVTLENPDSPIIELSDKTGISNYGGLLYNRGDAKINQLSFFINDNAKIGSKLNIDAGLRYNIISHKGEKDRSSPSFVLGGIDGEEATAYNNSVLQATEKDAFDFDYKFMSWSLGANYLISDKIALFTRVSNGHKAPEMNYYFNNFDGVPIDIAGTKQDIFQGELGVKMIYPKFNLFTTAFFSQLDNIAFSEFVLDQQDGSVFFTPIQLNKTTTIGLEVEGGYALFKGLDINFKATLQNPEATRFQIYNANGTVDQTDDNIIDYSGNKIPHNPNVMLEVSPNYTLDKLSGYVSLRYMGERKGNVSNAFTLPAFSTINARLGYQINDNINLTLIANNLFNSTGLMNFFGPNEFGSNSNAASSEYIQENPEASFVVFPIGPRSIFLKVGYSIK